MMVGGFRRGIGGVIRMGGREGVGIGRGRGLGLDLDPDQDRQEEKEKDDDQDPAHQEETTAEDTMTDDEKITKKTTLPYKISKE